MIQHRDDGQAPDKLRDHPEADQVFRGERPHQLLGLQRRLVLGGHRRKTKTARAQPTLHDSIESDERPTTDKQNIGGVDLDIFLIRMLPTALRGHIAGRALENLQERLLDTFTRNVPCDGNVLRFASNLVDLIDVDNATLGLLHIVVRRLQETEDDVFDVLADVARFRERGRIGNGKRHVEYPREGAREQRLARAGGTEEHDIALLDLDVVKLRRQCGGVFPRLAGNKHEPLVVVVDGNREHLLGVILTNHVVIKRLLDRGRFDQAQRGLDLHRRRFDFTINDRLADIDA